MHIGRTTTYAIMGAGLHGQNGVNPTTSWHIYQVYVQPRVIYSLEALNINSPNMTKLEVAMRTFLKHIMTLPERTANTGVYILIGCLPVEATIHQRQLIMVNSLKENSTMLDIIISQIASKALSSNSWFVATQKLLRRYKLPPLLEIMAGNIPKEAWKSMVKKAISTHWKNSIEEEANTKSTLKHMNTTFTPGQPHLVWKSTNPSHRDVRRAHIKAKLMTGTYILQSNRAAFNQTTDKTCPMCNGGDESIAHFIMSCPASETLRHPFIQQLHQAIPLVYQDHPRTGWSEEMSTQLVLDPTHEVINEILPLSNAQLYQIEKISRRLCFKLHSLRATQLGYKV